MLFRELYDSLDKCEKILQATRYITGDTFTMADIRLFVTLIRFDEVRTEDRNIPQHPTHFDTSGAVQRPC